LDELRVEVRTRSENEQRLQQTVRHMDQAYKDAHSKGIEAQAALHHQLATAPDASTHARTLSELVATKQVAHRLQARVRDLETKLERSAVRNQTMQAMIKRMQEEGVQRNYKAPMRAYMSHVNPLYRPLSNDPPTSLNAVEGVLGGGMGLGEQNEELLPFETDAALTSSLGRGRTGTTATPGLSSTGTDTGTGTGAGTGTAPPISAAPSFTAEEEEMFSRLQRSSQPDKRKTSTKSPSRRLPESERKAKRKDLDAKRMRAHVRAFSQGRGGLGADIQLSSDSDDKSGEEEEHDSDDENISTTSLSELEGDGAHAPQSPGRRTHASPTRHTSTYAGTTAAGGGGGGLTRLPLGPTAARSTYSSRLRSKSVPRSRDVAAWAAEDTILAGPDRSNIASTTTTTMTRSRSRSGSRTGPTPISLSASLPLPSDYSRAGRSSRTKDDLDTTASETATGDLNFHLKVNVDRNVLERMKQSLDRIPASTSHSTSLSTRSGRGRGSSRGRLCTCVHVTASGGGSGRPHDVRSCPVCQRRAFGRGLDPQGTNTHYDPAVHLPSRIQAHHQQQRMTSNSPGRIRSRSPHT